MTKIAILGYGTIGSGVAEAIDINKDIIKKRSGVELFVKRILDLREFPGDPHEDVITHDFEKVVEDEEIDIVVETMGGVNPACLFVKRCMEAGKSVVTSNKELVADHGSELLMLAKEKGVNFLFEASVGGGIPIIRTLNSALTADDILEVTGILNGTTNYMMTKMFYEGADYDEVLKEAQENGFAEANPKADVEGYDACRKIAILSSIVSGHQVDFNDIYCQGITKITSRDMQYAKRFGATIKLLGSVKMIQGKLMPITAPFLLFPEHPLYKVDGVFNAIFVKGNILGDAMFYGSGAGKLPTASAVVADVIEAAKNPNKTIVEPWSDKKLSLADKGQGIRRFFVRMKGDRDKVKEIFESDLGVIEIVYIEGIDKEEFGFITAPIKESDFHAILKDSEDDIIRFIRIED